MPLLLDNNLSYRVVEEIADVFHASTHVKFHGMETASDEQIWEFAKYNGLTIVSKDSDFLQRSMVNGHPPKVVWLRIGNCSTQDVVTALISSSERIEAFLQDDTESLLVLDRPFG